jgi:hypothetical protein
MSQETNVVYWLFDETCVSLELDGYVGVTCDLPSRLSKHRSVGLLPKGFKVTIIFTGTRDECLKFEKDTRPKAGIGWNRCAGGMHGTIHSEESRRKIAAANLGKGRTRGHKLSDEHKAAISAAKIGRKHTAQARDNMRKAQAGAGLGRKLSAEHVLSISNGLKGRIVSAETRAKIAIANVGNKNSLGRVISEETRAKFLGNKYAAKGISQ